MRLKNSEMLLELATALVQQNESDQIPNIVSFHTESVLQADATLVLLINPQTRETIKTIVREGIAEQNRNFRNLQNQLSGWILDSGQPLLIESLKTDVRFGNVLLGDLKLNSIIGVPIRIERILIGVLLAMKDESKHVFKNDDLAYLENVAVVAAPYLRNAQKIQNYFEAPLPNAALLSKYADYGLLGKSKSFIESLRAVESAARCSVRVVLEGRSGTGKGLIARAIHELSERKDKPFIAIDCGALSEQLIESELFGHVKGAFTGATQNRDGLLVEANDGTLFLDEISNISSGTQVKLLRALQDGEVRPVGSNKNP